MSSVLATGARTGRWIKRTLNLGGRLPRLMHRIEYLHLYKSGGKAGDGESGSHETALLLHTFTALHLLVLSSAYIARLSIVLLLCYPLWASDVLFPATRGRKDCGWGYPKSGPLAAPHKRAHVT